MNDLKIHQNTTCRVLAKLLDAEGKPLNAAGWTIRSQIREEVDAALVAAFKVTETAEGLLLSLSATQTSNILPGMYQFDVLGQSPDGDTFLLAEGAVEVLATITELP